MAGHSSDASLADVNFQRYCNCLFRVGQRELCRVFKFLYDHHQPDPTKYVGDILDPDGSIRAGRSYRGSPARHLDPREWAILERRESPENMDISLLYSLLQLTCGLKPNSGQNSVWTRPVADPNAQCLEYQLYLLKELRNDLCHRPQSYTNLTDELMEEKVGELERLCCQVVKKAAKRTGRSPEAVNSMTVGIKSTIRGILHGNRSSLHPQQWTMLARREQQETPINHHEDFFADSMLRVPMLAYDRWSSMVQQQTFDLLDDILSWRYVDGSQPQLILVRGETGVGKSTFCQQIWKSWLSRESAENSECDLVLKVECGQVTTRDVGRLVQEELLPRASQHCDPGQVVNLLDSLRVVWLLDGLEEPAPEAIHLLREILRKFSNKHLVMVTCQHSYVSEVLRMADDIRVCEARLEGLSGRGAHSLIRHLLQDQDELYDKFLGKWENFDIQIKVELQNPLKLKLAVSLWKEGSLDTEAGLSLPHLYKAVEATLVDKVSAKISGKSNLTKSEATDRIYAWLNELYKTAFDMTARNQLLLLDINSTRILKDKSLPLLPSYTDCFSTFLTRIPPMFSWEICYQFRHLTQQRYLAAQHLSCQVLSSPCPASALREILQLEHPSVEGLDRFYVVLLFVIANLVSKKRMEKKLQENIITAFSKCRSCNWMEVLRCACYSEHMAKLISRHMPDTWIVTDDYLQAATLLIKHTTPSFIRIKIFNNPDELDHIMTFLKLVAATSSEVWLNYTCYEEKNIPYICDKYLQVLCSPTAKCNLTMFTGSLTADG